MCFLENLRMILSRLLRERERLMCFLENKISLFLIALNLWVERPKIVMGVGLES